MLNPEIIRLAERQITNKFKDSDEQLGRTLTRTVLAAAAQGATGSGRTGLQLVDACKNDIRVRAAIALDAYTRTIRATAQPLPKDAGTALRSQISQAVSAGAARSRAVLERTTTYRSLTAQSKISEERFRDILRAAEDAAKEHADTEAEIFLTALSSYSAKGEQAGTVRILNYGNVGTIQTGSGASASVNMAINQEDKVALKEALQALRSAIEVMGPSEFPSADQTVATIDAVAQELESAAPNKVTLGGLLLGIGVTISTMADLQPAYDMLKSAASLIGISLP